MEDNSSYKTNGVWIYLVADVDQHILVVYIVMYQHYLEAKFCYMKLMSGIEMPHCNYK